MSARAFIGVHPRCKVKIPVPTVFQVDIRPDIVSFIHNRIRQNRRQAHGVSRKAGHQTSAESWGTGRAVARIPRVRGGGTHRSGQGAFGNMCRGGRMFAPIRTWRKLHAKVPEAQKKYAIASAIAASGSPALVMSKGHIIDKCPEFPMVVSDDSQYIRRTKDAVKFLRSVHVWQDVLKVYNSKRNRAGKGKMRNRRKVKKIGPLIIYLKNGGITRAFRNIPGVSTMSVRRMNLLEIAPGGHMGRLILWTESAFKELETIYGNFKEGTSSKVDFTLPARKLKFTDLKQILQSDAIRQALRPRRVKMARKRIKPNPLVNARAMDELNPYAKVQKRIAKKQICRDITAKKIRNKEKTENMKQEIKDAAERELAERKAVLQKIRRAEIDEKHANNRRKMAILSARMRREAKREKQKILTAVKRGHKNLPTVDLNEVDLENSRLAKMGLKGKEKVKYEIVQLKKASTKRVRKLVADAKAEKRQKLETSE